MLFAKYGKERGRNLGYVLHQEKWSEGTTHDLSIYKIQIDQTTKKKRGRSKCLIEKGHQMVTSEFLLGSTSKILQDYKK